MTISFPEGVYTMQTNRSIIKFNARDYHKAARVHKTAILNDLVKTTHLHRKYLNTLLNRTGKVYYTPQGIKLIGDPTVTYTHKRGRKKVYTEELVPYLKILWELSWFRAAPYLVYFIRHNPALLDAKPADFTTLSKVMRRKVRKLINAPPVIKGKLRTASAATVERLLKKTKDRLRFQHRYHGHPHASVIKKNIPVESYLDKPKHQFGYMETDTVHHCGQSTQGNYSCTLTTIEITTDWTENRALRNRAQCWIHKALNNIRQTVPFKIVTLHSDNGVEFINDFVYTFTQTHDIRFTRSRAYQKNDAPYVESRNWTLVRTYVGYRRYNTDAEFRVLEKLIPLIALKHNYFMPTMKLTNKTRVGGKIYKEYDFHTPYERMLDRPELAQKQKAALRKIKFSLSYWKIFDEIVRLQLKLDKAWHQKYHAIPKDDND